MPKLRRRRWINVGLTTVAIVVVVAYFEQQRSRLEPIGYTSGYWMAGVVVALISFHWRKKLTFLPIGGASTWMQVHIYLGIFSLPLFLVHTGWRIPDGIFERMLATNFIAVAASGVVGLFVTRTYPRRLTNSTEEFVYERIPAYRNQLQTTTRNLVLQVAAEHGNTTLADFYVERLGSYFEQPRSLAFQLLPDTRKRRHLMADLSRLQRYLSDAERQASDRLFHLIRKKDDLDYQEVLQRTLKLWLFVHIALSYTLLILGSVHAAMALSFRGGW